MPYVRRSAVIEAVRAQPTRLVATFAAAALAVSLAACSSSGGAAKTTPTPSTSAVSSSTPVTSSPVTTPSPSETVSVTDLTKTLLTSTDLGLTGATSTPAKTTDNPLPCEPKTGKSLNQQVPATARAGVDISDDALQAAFSEEVRLFADAATASAALTVAKAGLNCTAGSLRADDGTETAAKIQAPVDIASDLAGDTKLSVPVTAALVWQATVTGEDVDLAVVQIDRSLVLFTFQSLTGADLTKLPSPEDVIKTGLEKIEAS
jgi:hypothetical protein